MAEQADGALGPEPAAYGVGADARSVSERLADWVLSADEVPADVAGATRLRILDTLGLALAGRTFDVGRAVLRATEGAESGGATVIGGPGRVPAVVAALVNGSLAEAIEFDDSHNETVVHVSSPVVAAALAAAELHGASGAQLIRAVALAAEVTCRLAVGAPGMFHPLGFHPTGIFGAFGAAVAASLLGGGTRDELVQALGIVGGFAAGSLESWSDGSWGKLISPGWAAQAGLWAHRLAASGFSGPRTVFEGKFGLFASHLGPEKTPALGRILDGLGTHWESRAISFKPYPNAHVMHGVLDAVIGLIGAHDIDAAAVRSVHCRVAPYMVGLICEPEAEKREPPTAAQARISLHHSVAELLSRRRMDVTSYAEDALADPAIRDLARRVSYSVVPAWTSRAAYPGGVRIELADGTVLERVETANLGSAAKPMSAGDIERKFLVNAALVLPPARAQEIADAVRDLDRIDAVGTLLALCRVR